MNKDCRYFQEQIPKAMVGDLEAEEQPSLDAHLAECVACRQERELYSETLSQMRALEDVAVPRHFFVYPEERAANPWQLFRMMHPAWQGVAAAGLLVGVAFVALAVSQVHVRSKDGAWTIAFGNLPAVSPAPAPSPKIDTAALEARILQIVEEKNRKEKLEWVRTLRSEINRSHSTLTRQQQIVLENALAGLESRMGSRMEQTARSVEERNNSSIASLYQAVSQQRELDLAAMDRKLTGLAVSGEMKETQTNAILETLLQVAELRMK